MGEIEIKGKDSLTAINYFCSNNIEKIKDGQAQYTALLNEGGGVVDDLIVYRHNENTFLLCVNASNATKDLEWLNRNNKFDIEIIDKSRDFGQIALQGPYAEKILAKLCPEVTEIKKFYFANSYLAAVPLIIARTGYTGEDGFEIFIPTEKTEEITNMIFEQGQSEGLKLCGLGARDSLRLEAGYPLHGHELREDLPAIYSGLSWIIDLGKGDFIGKDALKDLPLKNKLVGLRINGRGIVREKTDICDLQGNKVGETTSGTKTPSLDFPIAMAIIDSNNASMGNKLIARVRNRDIDTEVVKLPF